MKKEFIAFLEANDVAGKFLANVDESMMLTDVFNVPSWVLVTDAFDWTKSPEGKAFWGALDVKWQEIINK